MSLTGTMPSEIADSFRALWNDVVNTNAQWRIYKALFNDSESTVKLLNDTAPVFFSSVQHALADSVLLCVGRLLDTRSDTNALAALPRLLAVTDPRLADTLNSMIAKAKDAATPIISHRHKRIAHTDTQVRLAKAMLQDLTVASIDKSLDSIADIMNVVESRFDTAQTNFAQTDIGDSVSDLLRDLGLARTIRHTT
jgi:hypothetical protein